MIIENIFSQKIFRELKNILYSPTFDWKYVEGVAYDISDMSENLKEKIRTRYVIDDPTFTQIIYNPENQQYHRLFEKIEFLIHDAFERNKIALSEILRIRAGMILSEFEYQNRTKVKVHLPHIDKNRDHKTALIYFTTCDAPTIVYDQKHDVRSKLNTFEYLSNQYNFELSEKTRVDCIENRMFVFDGLHYHSSTRPTNVQRRIAFTINFI